ncbi:replication protein RepA [Alteromonas pelagimontana]|uniref:Replication protein RepA n=1 Tax=Alteromonas pelagimontana TaxID=1858656 RepID=A0A6M4MAH8_9ALTE|nr:hypothetical protein [Alteromonas pelagimontana]QJR80037.1 replication protein RepA [Alteromonas pelagimontana]
MGLCSLKKSTPSVNPKAVSIEEFIDDALVYASGQHALQQGVWQDDIQARNTFSFPDESEDKPKRRATFTLTESTIFALSEIAELTGISRSRLIRIWAEQQRQEGSFTSLINSKIP